MKPLGEAGALVLGTAVSGLLTYLLLALGTRSYDAADFAPVSVLWSFWSMSAAALTLPIQHWMIRRAVLDGHDGGIRVALPRLAGTVLALAAVLVVGTFVARVELFDDERLVWPLLAGLLPLSAALSGWIRGALAARQRFYALANVTAGESMIRLLVGAIAVSSQSPTIVFASALLAGPLVGLAFPESARLSKDAPSGSPELGFLGGSASGFLGAQVLLNSGPIVLAYIGGQPAYVTSLFVCLAIFRTPYVLMLGATARFTGPLTRYYAGGSLRRLRRLLVGVSLGTLGLLGSGAFLGYTLGPSLLRWVFGSHLVFEPWVVAGVVAGSTLALGALALMQFLIAAARITTLVAASIGACLFGLLAVVLLPYEPVLRVVGAFVVAEVVAFVWMLTAASAAASTSKS